MEEPPACSPRLLLDSMDYALALQDACGLLLGLAAFYVTRERERSADGRILLALGGLLAVVGLVGGQFVFHNGFAVMRLWFHAWAVVLAPLLVVAGVRAGTRGRWFSALALTLAGGCAIGTAWYATQVEPRKLEVNRHAITSAKLPSGMTEPLVVAIVADLQTDAIGDHERHLFRTLDDLKPDLLLLPGDYLQCRTPEAQDEGRRELAALFQGLRHAPPLGIFAVDGDVDRAADSLLSPRVRPLVNETVRLDDAGLQIIGLSTPSSRFGMPDALAARVQEYGGLSLVFGHAPEFMNASLDGSFTDEAVFIAGHTHGGQIQIPGFGPPLTLARVPRWLAAGACFENGATTLVVSRGVGLERSYAPRVRLFCAPEIVVLELYGPAAR